MTPATDAPCLLRETDARGVATFAASPSAGDAARLAFTVKKVERGGYRYAPEANRETRDLLLR